MAAVTLRDLLKNQGIDPNALLRQHVGQPLTDGEGITAHLADGLLDLHIVFAVKNDKPEKPEKPARRKRKR
jgi:hypothetical protein